MRFLPLAAALGLSALLAGCSAEATPDAASSESEVSTTRAACSTAYWQWYLHELEPLFVRPIGDVSEAEMNAVVAKHPPVEETPDTYAVCWQPIFVKAFTTEALFRMREARTEFLAKGPSYLSLPAYEKNAAMTPEARRNAKAALALKPSTMSAIDTRSWLFAYDSLLAEAIEPVGVPGPVAYDEVMQDEWVVSRAEAEYLSIIEAAASRPSDDGSYAEWMDSTASWLFGPPLPTSSSYVFHLAWEPASSTASYGGMAGIEIVDGAPAIPAPVQSFLDRRAKSRPEAVGERDSAAWMSWYRTRGLRALANLTPGAEMIAKTDRLALDVLETMAPSKLEGQAAHDAWSELMAVAKRKNDAALVARFAKLEPTR